MHEFITTLKKGMACKCPKCGVGGLFPSRFSLDITDTCAHCGLDLSQNDNADGPAVFLIFILGFLLVPLALIFDHFFAPPLWVHGALWGAVAVILTLGALKPLKSYILYLQYKYRPEDWNIEP